MRNKQYLARLNPKWEQRAEKIRKLMFKADLLKKDTDYAFTKYALEFLIETMEGLIEVDIPLKRRKS